MRALAARLALTGVMALGVVSFSPAVLANGRFPESQRLLEDPRDPNRLYLTATYGLLVSPDHGKSWYSICEQAFALAYLEGDPLLEVLADGTLVSGIYVSLNVSRDCGCGWQATLAAGDKETVSDLTVDPNGHLLALVRDLSSGAHVRVHESADSGRTWTLLGNLPDIVNDAYTIDVAPSDPNRIYITAVTSMPQNPALLLASKDRGKTWTMAEIAGTSNAIQPFIAAVHPTNPDRLFVRTDDWEGTEDVAAEDALLESRDGGKTWTEVLRKNAKLLGFALSPSGDTILAGYGDPVQAGGRTSNPDDFGIYKASAANLQFERIFQGTVSCLRWTGQGLYACLVQNHPDVPTPGMSLGFAPNANFTMATANPLTSLLDVKNVKGPLACVASQCGNWKTGLEGAAAVCEQLGASCTADTTQNVLTCQAAGGSGGAGGAGTGGASGTGGAAGVGGPDAAVDGRDASGTGGGGGGGCGCALGPAGAEQRIAGAKGVAALASLLAGAAIWRRRRRRSRLPPGPAPAPAPPL